MTPKTVKSSVRSPLPSYYNPPVEEVVCGLRFEPVSELKVPHIGLLWEKLRKDYPQIQHAAPISSEQGILIDESTGGPLPRIWFIGAEDDQLIQLQGDRFYFNWRRRLDQYPRYATILQKFIAAKSCLDSCLDELRLGKLKPIEFELTYINHIPKGQGWETTDDLEFVFRDFNWQTRKGRFLPKPANYAWQVRFAFPEEQGSLSAKLSQGKRKTDGTPVLVLEMAARGMPNDSSHDGMKHWLDLAHEWIVRGFADLTTDEIQNSIWKREDGHTRHATK